MNDTTFTRRLFLQRGMTFVSLAATAPSFLQRSACGMTLPAPWLLSSMAGVPEDRVLVVVQLGGGNDGLNTVVPYGSAEYNRLRPQLAVPPPGASNGALQIDEAGGIGLHPNLAPIKELMDEGVASIVQGVGYPNPNRSHFTSMDIWHTASGSATGNGWLGRYFDNTCAGAPDPQAAVAIGRSAPLALTGDTQQPVTFESADLFRWSGQDLHETLERPYAKLNRAGSAHADDDSQLGYLTRTALDAQIASDRITAAVARDPLVPYPRTPLARQLRIVSSMIRDGLSTRVYYVTLSGFDTHANQAARHGQLLNQLGRALNAFYRDLKKQGNSGRVLTMVFSEFGRRVAQNASGGTDHGTAAPMYFIGDMVRPGLHGTHPSLSDLDEGDLKFNIDFRTIYATLLEDWMGAKSKPILGDAYRKARILK